MTETATYLLGWLERFAPHSPVLALGPRPPTLDDLRLEYSADAEEVDALLCEGEA